MTQQPWGPPSRRSPQWGRGPVGNPYGQNPYGQNPYGQNPYGFPPTSVQRGFGQNPYGAPPGGPFRRRPPRRRHHPFRLLVLAAIAVGLFMMASTAASNMASGGSSSSSTTTGNGQYQNDDYQVPPPDLSPPPIPQPETYEEAQSLLTQNAFYNQVTPDPVRCASDPINVDTASDAALKKHFDALMACLVRVWEPPVVGAQWQIVRPTVTIYGSEINTKCGKSGVNAFYCAADQQVYYSNRLDNAVPVVARDRWAADVVMAHEFGHALQARTAILISSQALGQQSNDEGTQLLFSRRLETQADCFSGMFIRSVAAAVGVQQSDVEGILEVYSAVGDDTLSGNPGIQGNHGLARSRQYWGNTGLGTNEVGQCNTYTARSSLVR
ncbi:MAG: neutral zinc metallopeptidase [Friedmanniella sp.]